MYILFFKTTFCTNTIFQLNSKLLSYSFYNSGILLKFQFSNQAILKKKTTKTATAKVAANKPVKQEKTAETKTDDNWGWNDDWNQNDDSTCLFFF